MRKCVKMIVTDYHDVDVFYKALKKRANVGAVEGVAEPLSDEELQIVVYGPKESVDEFVGAVEDTVITIAEEGDDQASELMVEPFIKEEDYRGVFRFIKKS